MKSTLKFLSLSMLTMNVFDAFDSYCSARQPNINEQQTRLLSMKSKTAFTRHYLTVSNP